MICFLNTNNSTIRRLIQLLTSVTLFLIRKKMVTMKEHSLKYLKEQYRKREITGGIYQITCTKENKTWLRVTKDIKGAQNLFKFSVSTNSCIEICMRKMWDTYGASSFTFEVIEILKKGDIQSDAEFREDLNVLLELYSIEKNKTKER